MDITFGAREALEAAITDPKAREKIKYLKEKIKSGEIDPNVEMAKRLDAIPDGPALIKKLCLWFEKAQTANVKSLPIIFRRKDWLGTNITFDDVLPILEEQQGFHIACLYTGEDDRLQEIFFTLPIFPMWSESLNLWEQGCAIIYANKFYYINTLRSCHLK